MKREEYNKEINLHIGALAESKDGDPNATHECHQARRWEHTERIMIATANYVGNGLKDDIADRIKSDFAALLEERERKRMERYGVRAFGRAFMKSQLVTGAFRTVLLALLTAVLVRSCGMTPSDARSLVTGAATAQAAPPDKP